MSVSNYFTVAAGSSEVDLHAWVYDDDGTLADWFVSLPDGEVRDDGQADRLSERLDRAVVFLGKVNLEEAIQITEGIQ